MIINIIGLGGVGLKILRELLDSGIAIMHLRLFDGDIVEEKNLVRQIYSESHIGIQKSDAAVALFNLMENDLVKTIECHGDLSDQSLLSSNLLHSDYTFIATDNVESRCLLLDFWSQAKANHCLISAANATSDDDHGIGSTAWIQYPNWTGDKDKDAMLRLGLASEVDRADIRIGRPCSEVSEPQTSLANSGAAIRAVELMFIHKWAREQNSPELLEYMPVQHSLINKQVAV